MAQPSKIFHWATGGGAVVTDPPGGKQDTGFQLVDGVPEKPAMDYFNSILSVIFAWLLYLKNLTGEALTWTAAHIFGAAVTFNGTTAFVGQATFTPDPTFSVRIPTNLVLAAGWLNPTMGDKLRYWKDPDGVVTLLGWVRTSGTATSPTATLPMGFRPLSDLRIPVIYDDGVGGEAVAKMSIDALGNIAFILVGGGVIASGSNFYVPSIRFTPA
jgi:hypothetical protein